MENKENKNIAICRGVNLPISTKHAMAICKFLKGKKVSIAIAEMEKIPGMKLAIPFKGEIPHKKGIPARYPVNASKVFVKLLKSLAANASQKGIDLDKAAVHGHADRASRPHKPGKIGRRKFKRTHVMLTLGEKS
jgi:ribosomal protein L22